MAKRIIYPAFAGEVLANDHARMAVAIYERRVRRVNTRIENCDADAGAVQTGLVRSGGEPNGLCSRRRRHVTERVVLSIE